MIDPVVGKEYLIKTSSGNRTLAKCSAVVKTPGFNTVSRVFGTERHHRADTRYVFLNLRTGREIVLHSRVKILAESQGVQNEAFGETKNI